MASAARRAPRVVSVLPSATEMLCHIGGGHLLVGRSHEDNYPTSITHLPVVTGQKTEFTTAIDVDRQVSEALSSGQSLYTIDEKLIASLRPDVILTQDICSVCAIDLRTVERMAATMDPRPAVVSLNPLGLEDVLRNLLEVGEAVGMQAEAAAAKAALEARLSSADELVAEATRQRQQSEAKAAQPPSVAAPPCVAFIEWPDPLYVGGHWTPQLIERAGGTHPLNPARRGGAAKSFAVPSEAMLETNPSLVVLAPCGLALPQTRLEAARMRTLPWWPRLSASCGGRVALVDGDAMFNRPGPRLVDAYEWLVATLHALPERAPPQNGFPAEWLPTDAEEAAAAAAAEAAEAAEAAAHGSEAARASAAAAKAAAKAEAERGALRDIEEAHACAVRKGDRSYTDPATGYKVFSQLASSDRGRCCGSGCRHCVHGHKNVPAARRATLPPPIVVAGVA